MAEENLSESFQLQVSQFARLIGKLKSRDCKVTKETLQNIKAFQKIDDSPMFLERYLQYPSHYRKKLFYQTLQINNIVLGKVCALSGNERTVKLINVVEGQKRWIADLQITATLKLNKSYDDDDVEELEVGDYIKALVTDTNETTEGIRITIDPSPLVKAQHQLPRLGKIEDEDTIAHYLEDDYDEDNDSAFLEQMRESCVYNHPQSIDLLASYFGVDRTHNGFVKRDKAFQLKESVDELREKQSFDWSMSMVGIGVKHFREKELKEAKKCFDQALTFYPKNVEGYVARGALKANQSDLRGAVDDFRKALDVNPNHRNGRKYLIETSLSLARSYEKDKKWKESSRCYYRILGLQPDHKEAKERYNQIHQLMSSKIIHGPLTEQPSPTAETTHSRHHESSDSKPRSKTKDRLEKLKKLLDESNNKKKKKRRRHSSESSSSSSSSSTSSVSSNGDGWIEKPTSSRSKSRHGRRRSESRRDRSRSRSRNRHRTNSDEREETRKRRKLSEEKHDDYDDDYRHSEEKYRHDGNSSRHSGEKYRHDANNGSTTTSPRDKDSQVLLRKMKNFSAEEIDIVKKMLRGKEPSNTDHNGSGNFRDEDRG